MGKTDPKIIALKKIQKKYPDFNSFDKPLESYAIIFTKACARNQLEIIDALIQNSDVSIISKIIHFDNNLAFYLAAENGHLEIINKLIKLTPDPKELDQMIHCDNDAAFRAAAENGHLPVVSRLVEVTNDPEKLSRMLHFDNDYVFRRAAKNGHLEINQYLLSCASEFKPDILHIVKNNKSRQKIEDSSKFIQKLIEFRENGGNAAVIKTFEYLKFGKIIATLVSVSKAFFASVCQPGILDIIIDYLGRGEVNIIHNEKIKIFNVVTENLFSRNDNGTLELKKNIPVDLTKNIQDQELTFVERIFVQKEINKQMPIVS